MRCFGVWGKKRNNKELIRGFKKNIFLFILKLLIIFTQGKSASIPFFSDIIFSFKRKTKGILID